MIVCIEQCACLHTWLWSHTGNRSEMVSMASAHVQFLITERKRFWSYFDVASAIGELQSKRWLWVKIMAFFVLKSSQNLDERQAMVYCESSFIKPFLSKRLYRLCLCCQYMLIALPRHMRILFIFSEMISYIFHVTQRCVTDLIFVFEKNVYV